MLQLNVQSIVQIGSLVVYAILISLVLCSKKVILKKLFTVLLMAASGIGLAGLLTNLKLPYEQLVFWKLAAVLFSTWLVIAYAHFITAYAGKNTGKVVKFGYAWLAAAFVIVACGYLIQGMNLLDNETVSGAYGYAINGVVIINDAISVAILFFIFNLLKKAAGPEERNRAAYLMAGSIIVVAASVLKYFIQDLPFAVSQVGYAINAIIIAYTLMKYRLLDIQVPC